jgi:hypothetical protein
MTTRKITRGQLRSVGLKLLHDQGGVCPLCGQPIDVTKKGEIVIDHDHTTGLIRGALHRSCNSGEGKAFSAVGRWIVGRMDYSLVIPALRRLADYLEKPPTNLVYHSHKSEDDKRELRAARERKRRAEIKAKRAMQRE